MNRLQQHYQTTLLASSKDVYVKTDFGRVRIKKCEALLHLKSRKGTEVRLTFRDGDLWFEPVTPGPSKTGWVVSAPQPWIPIAGMSSAQLVAQIRDRQVDLCVVDESFDGDGWLSRHCNCSIVGGLANNDVTLTWFISADPFNDHKVKLLLPVGARITHYMFSPSLPST